MIDVLYHAVMDDSFNIIKELSQVVVNFLQLGDALRIKRNALEIVESLYKDDPNEGLREVIQLWLKWCYGIERYGPPTWRMLAEAVAHPCGGANCAVAKRIAKEHPRLFDQGMLPHAIIHLPSLRESIPYTIIYV